MKHIRVSAALGLVSLAVIPGCTGFKRFAYEGFCRDRWQHPDEVVRVLAIEPGTEVADLGAGGGYFTFHLAEATGAGGKVYAVDVDEGMIEYLQDRIAEEGQGNVATVLAAYDDPRLPEGGIDLIFTCNTYHHIEDRPQYFARAKKYLRPDGRVAIIDYKREGFLQRLFGHATEENEIRSEMEAAGYRFDKEYEFLPKQSFLVFSKPAS